ncbi:MAG: trypsin-like peptidase domain-containing protein [Patescibacteria group bacterium]
METKNLESKDKKDVNISSSIKPGESLTSQKRIGRAPVMFFLIFFILASIFGFCGGLLAIKYYPEIFGDIVGGDGSSLPTVNVSTVQEKAVTEVVKKSIDSVVSILAKGEIPLPDFPGLSRKIESAGSGFIVSADGMILTNKHVVQYDNVEYTVILQDGNTYPAQVLARDPVQDLAVLKIQKKGLEPLALGDSENLEIGQTVIAIGNALGEFQNTVSVGVVSGLSRKITAGGGGTTETIEEVIQTDAAINSGNSGGPLLNLSGRVIGINTAVASGAENIGFAIPVDKAKKAIKDVKEQGKITYPFLGISYLLLNEALKTQYNLPVNYGAWVVKSEEGTVAVTPGSSADKAGVKEDDIILEMDGKKITEENSLSKMILEHKVGDKVNLKIIRGGKTISLIATLGERSE